MTNSALMEIRGLHPATWEMFEPTPPEELKPYVRGLQGYREYRSIPAVRLKAATGIVPLILVLEGGFALYDAETGSQIRPLRRSFVAGLHETPTAIGFSGSAACLQIDLTPLGAWKLLRIDMAEIAGRVVDLSALLGRAAHLLDRRLAASRTWRERSSVVYDFISDRIAAAPDPHPLCVSAYDCIQRSGGAIAIANLANVLGCSRKHLDALFHRHVGVGPKTLARLVRFEATLARRRRCEVRSLAELAALSGYADQAHLSRECRALTGQSLSAFVGASR